MAPSFAFLGPGVGVCWAGGNFIFHLSEVFFSFLLLL